MQNEYKYYKSTQVEREQELSTNPSTHLVAEEEAARHRHAVHYVVQQVRQHRQVARHLRARVPQRVLFLSPLTPTAAYYTLLVH